MECSGNETSLLPVPPPLPSNYSKIGFSVTGSKNRGPCFCSVSSPVNNNNMWDRMFDEGNDADVSILTDGGCVIYAHKCVLDAASPVLAGLLKQVKGRGRHQRRTISIRGAPAEAVRVFVRFLYSSCYEKESMKELALPLLALSHTYVVPELKRVCESWLERTVIDTENVMDIFQLVLLCDAPRLSLIAHRFVLANFKAVSATDGWRVMKESHPVLDKELRNSLIYEEVVQKERLKKAKERQTYIQLYEAMEALVHICKDGCRTIGPHDKVPRHDQEPCKYVTCKGLESLIRHFAGCKLRGTGGCAHCKRMWQLLELHSRLCTNSDSCKVPLCKNIRQRRKYQGKKQEIRWRILVKKIVRTSSITGAPFFTLDSTPL